MSYAEELLIYSPLTKGDIGVVKLAWKKKRKTTPSAPFVKGEYFPCPAGIM
jgi:hypothetical protein